MAGAARNQYRQIARRVAPPYPALVSASVPVASSRPTLAKVAPGESRPPGGSLRVCVLGATGTIGSATVDALIRRGHEVVCFVRPAGGASRYRTCAARYPAMNRARIKPVEVADPASLVRDAFVDEQCDAVISCLASRNGAPADAWAIDHRAQSLALQAARQAGVRHFVLLSAICVQKPLLAFQHAKLAFEAELVASGLRYSIVRPTALFKSLSGQIERVRRGKPFLIFGRGDLTACKPISDRDLADFIAGCLVEESRWNRILPIGGPGAAITPREQGEALFALLGRMPRFRSVPVALLDGLIAGLAGLGRLVPPMADKAEFARIGRYYATESMLVLNPATGRYDADATPATGHDTLAEFYRAVLAGSALPDRGEHAVF